MLAAIFSLLLQALFRHRLDNVSKLLEQRKMTSVGGTSMDMVV